MLRFNVVYLAAALLSAPVLIVNLVRTGKWRTNWRARFGHVGPVGASATPTVLIHGVSVGEISAIRTLVDTLSGADSPRLNVVISSTTNTGMSRARALFGHRHRVVRYPFDLSWMVRRFLDGVRPDVVLLIELEVWPGLVTECARRGIPVCVANGRLSASSMRGYRCVKRWMRPVFAQLAAVGAQTEEYARRFVELGTPAEHVSVTDTMKWDNVDLEGPNPRADDLADALGITRDRPLIVAGSTGPGEEEMLIATRPPRAQLLIVPRKPERFDEVAALDPEMVRRTDFTERGEAPPAGADVFLLDTMGELDRAYSLADVAVVGRSFVPMGGSDPIPPVASGRPTVIGPHHENFGQVVAALQEGGGIRVSDAPMAAAAELLETPHAGREMAERGRAIIEAHRGASRRSAELVVELLEGA